MYFFTQHIGEFNMAVRVSWELNLMFLQPPAQGTVLVKMSHTHARTHKQTH